MKVMTLFNEYRASNNNNVLNQDGIVNYYGKILPSEEANQYFDLLMRNIQWKNDDLVFFGKRVTTKRKVAWYGDSEYVYTYSNSTKRAFAWTNELFELKQIVEKYAGTKFNSCLLNLYHNGNEGMGWQLNWKEQYYSFVKFWSRTKILV
jgi:alkylated DNA repair dioxygenase AlkB